MIIFNKTTIKRKRDIRTTIENILSVVLLGIAIYLIATPFVPAVGLWWSKSTDKTEGYVYASNHPLAPKDVKVENSSDSNQRPENVNVKPIPKENRLVIPSINVDIAITEGPDARSLMSGGWRRPKTSTPEKGGNTVIAGHRFLYTSTNASFFYNLDKVKDGDPIIIYWKQKEYNYVVSLTKVVPSTAVEIEDNTKEPQLTLYTCTPLWTAKDRLVIVAKPI